MEKVLSVEPVNANWTGGSDGIIDNAAGTLTGLTRTDATPSQGDDEWVLFARVQFSGKAPVDEANHAFGPYNANLTLAQATLTVSGSLQPASVVADAAKVYAVIYDVNDDGRINSGDFSYFSAAYGGTVGSSESPTGPYYTWADFDGSGSVLSGDLSWLSPVYRKYTSEIDFYDMPNRYRPSAGPTGVRPDRRHALLCGSYSSCSARMRPQRALARNRCAASSTALASPGRTTTIVPGVTVLSQQQEPACGVRVCLLLFSYPEPGTRTREAAVDQLFACSAPLPTYRQRQGGNDAGIRQEDSTSGSLRCRDGEDVRGALGQCLAVGREERPQAPFDDCHGLAPSSASLDQSPGRTIGQGPQLK